MRSRWLAQGMSYHNLNLQNLLKRVTEAPAVGSNEQQYKWLVEGTDGTQRTVEKCVVIKFYLKAAGDEPAWSCAHCTAKGWSADRALCCIEFGMPTPMDEARFEGLRQDKRAQMAKRPTDRPRRSWVRPVRPRPTDSPPVRPASIPHTRRSTNLPKPPAPELRSKIGFSEFPGSRRSVASLDMQACGSRLQCRVDGGVVPCAHRVRAGICGNLSYTTGHAGRRGAPSGQAGTYPLVGGWPQGRVHHARVQVRG